MYLKTVIVSAIVGFVICASAHPGEHEEHNALAELGKREYKANIRRGLEKCSAKFEADGLYTRAAIRRAATVEMHRKRKKARRDTTSVLDKSHLYTGSASPNTSETVLFESNSTCVLNPEGETGPVGL